MDHPFIQAVFAVCALLCVMMYWISQRRSRDIEAKVSSAEFYPASSIPTVARKQQSATDGSLFEKVIHAVDRWIDKQLASESTQIKIQLGAFAAALPFAFLFHSTYYPALVGLYAFVIIIAIVIGFFLRPVRDVFTVRTTLLSESPALSRSMKHDQIELQVEVTRLWLLFLPTFAALAFFVVASVNGLTWWDSIAYPLVFIAQTIVVNVLSTWVTERSVLRDAKACFVDHLSERRNWLRYSFKDDAGEYYGGTTLRFVQIHFPEIERTVIYKALNPDSNKIASAFLFHQFKVVGRGLPEFDEVTATAHSAAEEECPEQIRLGHEIMQFLIKRETSLADALDALTTVMLNALRAKYGERDEFYRLSGQVSRFLGSTERDRAVCLIPTKQPARLAAILHPRTVTMVERPERINRLAIEVGQIITKCGPKSLGDALDALTSTMLTAIEATCGRERADEFDLLMAGFSKDANRFSGGRVQYS